MENKNLEEKSRTIQRGIGDFVCAAGFVCMSIGEIGTLYNTLAGKDYKTFLATGFIGLGATILGGMYSLYNMKKNEYLFDYFYRKKSAIQGEDEK